ncbi:MAG TPA: glycosyltransferase family 4 protein [Gaiellaceae bacterium]|jgi:glycosyltransferase involved in cell wall biosynthesis|nr:glycosyltransferase family 4 protein [Gaiellaceae bacterium]
MTRVTIVYPNPRGELIAEARAGNAPETTLLGLNQLAQHGFDVRVRDSFLDTRTGLVPKRVRWHLRELTLPWEAGETDVLFTPLANLIPLTARARRLPIVVFNFGVNTILRRGNAARRAALASALRQATAVVSLAASQRDELVELARIDPQRAHVALHGVDHRFFAPIDETPRERFVLAVGRDLARDFPTFLAAVCNLDARVVVLAVRARNFAGLELPANVEVREGVSWNELRRLYARAGCAVIPLRPRDYPFGSEASGVTALLEAEATATPIVATNRPIMREYLTHGESALLVPEQDPSALRAAICSLLDDPELAHAFGRAGRRRVVAHHTMDDMAAQLAPLLEGAAAVRRAR